MEGQRKVMEGQIPPLAPPGYAPDNKGNHTRYMI